MSKPLTGELTVVGISGRNYVFSFGWACRYNLEQVYGPNLIRLFEEKDQAKVIANVLLGALRAKPANQIPDEFGQKELYDLLDDLGEEKVKELWEAGKHSLGFLNRLLGLKDEDVAEMVQQATKNLSESPSPSTGTDS